MSKRSQTAKHTHGMSLCTQAEKLHQGSVLELRRVATLGELGLGGVGTLGGCGGGENVECLELTPGCTGVSDLGEFIELSTCGSRISLHIRHILMEFTKNAEGILLRANWA